MFNKPENSLQDHAVSRDADTQIQGKRLLLKLILLAGMVSLPLILFNNIPGKDTSLYYSAMIRAFGAGDWSHAFHPTIPPMFIIVGGLFSAAGLGGFTAAKVTSALFYILTLLPLWGIFNRVWDRRCAVTACLLYIFCSRLLRYTGDGTLDTGKTFFIMLTVYALVGIHENFDWKSSIFLAAGAAGMTLIRGEGLLFGFLAMIAGGAFILVRGSKTSGWLRLSAAAGLFILLIAPWAIYEYHCTGLLMTDSRQAPAIRRLYSGFRISPGAPALPATSELSLPQLNHGNESSRYLPPLHQDFSASIKEFYKGFYPQYLPLVIFGIILQIRRRKWTSGQSILAGALLIHNLFLSIFLALLWGVFISKRYLIPAAPLMFGWAATGMLEIIDSLKNHRRFFNRPYMIRSLLLLLILALIWNSYSRLRLSSEDRLEKEIDQSYALWLDTVGRAMIPEDAGRLNSTLRNYQNGGLPIVISVSNRRICFFAGADVVQITRDNRVWTVEEMIQICRLKQVHFLLWDASLVRICPELHDLNSLPAEFIIFPVAAAGGSLNDGKMNEAQMVFLGFTENLILNGQSRRQALP